MHWGWLLRYNEGQARIIAHDTCLLNTTQELRNVAGLFTAIADWLDELNGGTSAPAPAADTPAPSFEKTYRRADREHVDEFGWVTELDWFDDDDTPVELVEETWTRTAVRTFWHLPDHVYACEVEDDEPCEEDAVGWERTADGAWLQVCERHRLSGGAA